MNFLYKIMMSIIQITYALGIIELQFKLTCLPKHIYNIQ